MDVAKVLFATNGFEGTSVRKIAADAEVNLAAINYHFSSKENLLKEILRVGYIQCSQEIEDFYRNEESNLEETLVKLYHYFLENSHDLVAHFKIMMSSQLGHKVMSEETPDELFGPPGGKVICEAITKEVGNSVSDKSLHWALKCLFSHVVHMCLMQNACFKENSNIPFSSPNDIEEGIRRLTKIVVSELRQEK